MELRKVETKLEDVLKRSCTYSRSENMRTVEEFLDSGMDIAEVIYPIKRYKNNYTAASSLNATIKTMHAGCKAITRSGKTYLIRNTVLKS